MGFLRPEDTAELTKIFEGLERTVSLDLVSDDPDLGQLLDELAATGGGKIALTKRPPKDGERNPSMAMVSDTAKGKLVFEGLPVGYEMATLVGAIADLGGLGGQALVSPEAQAKLDALASDVKLEVFSTPG